MDNKIILVLLSIIILTTIKKIESLPYHLCKKGGPYGHPNCENIYVWNKKLNTFMSMFNVSFEIDNEINPYALEGKTVRVIADNMLPYITSSNESQDLGGYLGDIWEIIEDTLKFKSNVSSVFYDTGLDIITSGKADVMLAAVVNKKGLINIKYTQPYFYNWYHLYTKSPGAKASSLSYLKTFDDQLWFVTLITFVILTTLVWLTIKFINLVYHLEPSMSFPSCFLGITSGFINQGFDLKLSSYSARIIVMSSLTLGVVLYSAINAVLVSQLTINDVPAFPFTSLGDIGRKSTHSLCLRTNSFVYNNFIDTNGSVLKQWVRILNKPGCLDINDQTNLPKILCKNNLVVFENRVVMSLIKNEYNLPCELSMLPEKYYMTGNSFLILNAFKHKKLINGLVKKMRAAGILQRLEDKWIRREKLVNINVKASPQITLNHVTGIIVLYYVMVFSSLLIFLIEKYYYNYTLKQQFYYLK